MLEICLAGCLNTNKELCSEFPIICKESTLFSHTCRNEWILTYTYFQSKCVKYVLKVSSYMNVSVEYFKESVFYFYFFSGGELQLWSWIDLFISL